MVPLERFVAEREPHWRQLADIVRRLRGPRVRRAAAADIDQLAALVRQVSTDLAVAARDYPGDALVAELSRLLLQAQPLLYRAPPARLADLLDFFRRGLPRRFRAHGPYVGAAALTLLVGMAAGWAAVARRPDLRGLIPAGLRAGIAAHHLGNPAALSGAVASPMAAFIIQNNLRVALLAFGLGLLGGVPTLLLLLVNGFQLGSYAEAAHQGGLDLQFWALIVPHGVIELTVICIAAGTGLRLGDAWLRPGLQRRTAALALAARPAAQLATGAACLLIVAGVIEGFVTPSALDPRVKVGIGAASALLLYGWLLGAGRSRARRPAPLPPAASAAL